MKKADNVLMVYMTFANQKEADKIAVLLVKKKLAACVNILGAIQSVYEWKGKIENTSEIAAVAKTTTDRFAEFEREVKIHHSYECPCIVAWPIELGHATFLDWVRKVP